jgi:hypothetical protein
VLTLLAVGLAGAAIIQLVPEPPIVPPFGRLVDMGFAMADQPTRPLDPGQPLLPDRDYYFWVVIGPPVDRAGPGGAANRSARLAVVLFSVDGGLTLLPGEDTGELELRPDGSAPITVQAVSPERLPEPIASAGDRLYFPIRTSARVGRAHLRCNLYHQQTLIQSHLVNVAVQRPYPAAFSRLRGLVLSLWRRLRRRPRAPQYTVDFTLAPSLDPGHLSRLAPHRLSILVNLNGDGTHSLRIFGPGFWKGDVTFDGHEIQHLVELARGALRRAAWGRETPWQKGLAYLYARPRRDRFTLDLALLATRGYQIYDQIIERFSGGREQSDELARQMLQPGSIQVVHKRTPRLILPAGLIYDYPLDPSVPITELALCPTFAQVLDSRRPLAESPCFTGACPSYEEQSTVCPSGFWGFRHQLGMPLSVDTAPDAPTELVAESEPRIVVGVSTDPQFVLRKAHEGILRTMRNDLGWFYADTRAEFFERLRVARPHLVYLYCHGGLQDDGRPFLQVGGPGERGILRASLRTERIYWKEPRPLVFINGCHTTAVEPEVAFNFVSGFIETAGASGVIGTEITIFEPLARVFAEECLRHFLDGVSIGESIRAARLALLEELNPLGLVYIPFVLNELHLNSFSVRSGQPVTSAVTI